MVYVHVPYATSRIAGNISSPMSRNGTAKMATPAGEISQVGTWKDIVIRNVSEVPLSPFVCKSYYLCRLYVLLGEGARRSIFQYGDV